MQASQSNTASSRRSIHTGTSHTSNIVHLGTTRRGDASRPHALTPLSDSQGLAHDAGNLLGALQLYSELLGLPGVLREEHQGYAQDLKLLTQRSWSMIHRLVNYAGQAERPDTHATIVPDVVTATLGVLSRIAGRPVEVSCAASAFAPVNIAPEALERILTNLIKNAAEATPYEGRIAIAVQAVTTSAGQRLLLTVSDTGAGMSSELTERLQGTGPLHRGPGRGIGFRVVRELVALSGGCLHIASKLGTGTAITVEWDTVATPASRPAPPPAATAQLAAPTRSSSKNIVSPAAAFQMLRDTRRTKAQPPQAQTNTGWTAC